MITKLDDGRIFKTLPILNIEFKPKERVYKYIFKTSDRIVKSSSSHLWGVWDSSTKELTMKKMEDLKVHIDHLLIQE